MGSKALDYQLIVFVSIPSAQGTQEKSNCRAINVTIHVYEHNQELALYCSQTDLF